MSQAFVPDDVLHLACGVCPSRRFAVGEFDVFERPTKEAPFNAKDGNRYTAAGVPVCVHPEKVGLPAARYKSEGAPLRIEVVLPADESEVIPYLHDLFYGAAPFLLGDLLEQAKAEVSRAFPKLDVTATIRGALG